MTPDYPGIFTQGSYDSTVDKHFSNQRASDLAFGPGDRLWAVRWTGSDIEPSTDLISFPMSGRTAGRPELEYRLTTGEISYDINLTNIGDEDLKGPLMLLLDPGRTFGDAIAGASQGDGDQSDLWVLDLGRALEGLGGKLAVGTTLTNQTVSIVHAGQFAARAGLADLVKANLGHGVYAFPQDNLPPVLTVPGVADASSEAAALLPAASVGQPWTADIEAIDTDGSRFHWQLVRAPAGVTLQAASDVASEDDGDHNRATLSWTPGAVAAADSEILVRVQDSRGGVAWKRYQLAVAGGNHAPVLDAPADLTLAEGETLALPIAAADADGDPLTLTLRNLPAGAVFDARSGMLTWRPGYDQAGTYRDIIIEASDAKQTVRQHFNITVEQGYPRPLFNAVAPQTLREGERYTLQLTASIPGNAWGNNVLADGTTVKLEYAAPWLPGGATLNPETGWFEWTPGFNQHGQYTMPVSVIATWTPPPLQGEGRGGDGVVTTTTTVTRDIAFNVLNANGAPIFEPSLSGDLSWNIIEGQPLRVSIFAFDPDNPEFEPRIRLQPGASAVGPETTAPTVSYDVQGLPEGATFDAETMEILWTPSYAQAGTWHVTVTATDTGDGTGSPAVSRINLPIVVANANRAPQVGDISNAFVDKGGVVEIPVTAKDVDGNPVEISISGLPRFATYTQNPSAGVGNSASNVSGVIRFAPGEGDRGDYTITVTARDNGDGNINQVLAETRSFVLTVRSLTEKPVIAAPKQVVALVGQPLSVAFLASDLDQDGLTWSTDGLPVGAKLELAPQYGHATLTWTPTADDIGTRDIDLIVTDSGLSPQDAGYANPDNPAVANTPNVTRHTLRIVVRNANTAPSLLGLEANGLAITDTGSATPVCVNATEGVPLSLALYGFDSDLDLVNWSATGLPRGMRFTPAANGSRATLDWTPDLLAAQDSNTGTAGLWRFTVTGSDGSAQFVRTVEITVANVNHTPRILPMPLQLVREGETLNFTVRTADADNDAVQLSLVHDDNTPAGILFDAASGTFEWTPDQNTVDDTAANDKAWTFGFKATDGSAETTQTVQVRVFDVNRAPRVTATSHAVLLGDTLSLPVDFGGRFSTGILVNDDDGAAQTQALSISFSNLPEGASYNAQTKRLVWTPAPGQIGDTLVSARVSDGRNTVTERFILRVVADAAANTPKIVVVSTPSTPVLPGQLVTATIRAGAWSGLASVTAEMREPGGDWQAVTLDAAGRLRLTPSQPGLIELRITATDRDGFVGTQTHTLRVKDPADTAAPQLAWQEVLIGATANTEPRTITEATPIRVHLAEQQLMGWRLAIAPAGSNTWSTLAEASASASNVDGRLALSTLDPQMLANGAWQLRVTAWDLSGRSSEVDANLIVDTATKRFDAHVVNDAMITLDGHTLAINRLIAQQRAGLETAADFGNWQMPLLATRLTTDQPATLESGATAAWREGARVWLSVPAALDSAGAGLTNLSFTLATTALPLGNELGAPQVWRPVFNSDHGWQLEAYASDAADGVVTQEALVRQGDSLYNQADGMPWVPVAYTLTAPSDGQPGTRYRLDGQGHIIRIDFADGKAWLVSDAGVVALGGDTAARVDFLRDSVGRISRISYPGNQGEATAMGYRYEATRDAPFGGSTGRLVLARQLNDTGLGTPVAYDQNGDWLTDAITANLGAATGWNGIANMWNGELTASVTATLAFAVRESEIASTVHVPGGQGAVIVALESGVPADAVIEVSGARVVGQHTANGKTTRLLRVTEAGVKLIRLSSASGGLANARITLAGDLNADSEVNGADSAIWEPAQATANPAGDINGDGSVNSLDRQVLFANNGFTANRAPATAATLPSLKTHTDLAGQAALGSIAEDLEGDSVFWRILGSTQGTARLSADGQFVSFTPEAGYTGEAAITLQADDGFATGAPVEIKVNVSGAKLLNLHLAQLPALSTGQLVQVKTTADFEDERGVAVSNADYLHLESADLVAMGAMAASGIAVDDARDLIRVTGDGPALIIVKRVDCDGRLVQAAQAINTAAAPLPVDPNAADDEGESADEPMVIQPDVYPGTLTLTPGGTRQLKVHLVDAGTGEQTDIHNARQNVFAGSPEQIIDDVDPDTGESTPITLPAVPPVYSGTRYLVSDAAVATVSEDGLITAIRSGQVTVSIVHLASVTDADGFVSEQVIGQTDITLLVEAAQAIDSDPATATPAGIAITAEHGGVVQAATGETVLIGAGTLKEDVTVSICRIELASLAAETGMTAPEPSVFQALGAFHLEVGEQTTNVPLQLSITLQETAGLAEGDEILFLRRGVAPGSDGQMQDTWWITDNGFVGRDDQGRLVARTASPPYNGINGSGDLVCAKVTVDSPTGAVKIKGSGINLFALMMKNVALSFAGTLATSGGLAGAETAVNVIGSLAAMSDIYAVDMAFGGVYQVVPVQKNLADGDLTLTIESPEAKGFGTNTAPRITHVEMLASGKIRLTLDNLQPPAVPGMAAQAAAQRIWISPDELTVDEDGHATSEQWRDDNQPRRDGMRLWQKLIDLAPVAADATTMSVELDVPDQIATSLHAITVQRMVNTLDPGNLGATQWVADGEPGSVTVEAQTDFKVVTQGRLIQIFKNDVIVKEIEFKDENGTPMFVGGSKTDQIAFSLDNRLMFIAGMHGDIQVVDTATMKLARSFSVGTANISSLAVSGDTLYVAEGGYYNAAGGYRLLTVNINETDADFLKVKQIDLPGDVSGANAPYGYVDMAMLHGVHNYLAVTASKESLGVGYPGGQKASGNVFLLDLDQLSEFGGRWQARAADAFVQVTFPANQGKGPQYIDQAGIKEGKLRFVLSDALDGNAGFATVTLELDENGRFKGAPTFNRLAMLGNSQSGTTRLDSKYQLNIQRAQSPSVVVSQAGVEYALVADYFFDFIDPLYRNDDLQQGARQMGGKIGIIKDPFGRAPEYLGATSPIIDANFNRLMVSDDGKSLWAELRYWPTIGDAPPPSGILVWQLDKLIAAAEQNSLVKQAAHSPLPIDRKQVTGGTELVVTPRKYDLAGVPNFASGWLFGMAESKLIRPDAFAFTDPVGSGHFLKVEPDQDYTVPEINYGDIARIDLFKLIRTEYKTSLAGVRDADLIVNWDNVKVSGAVQLVTDGKGFLLTAEREADFASAEAAARAEYKGLQSVGGDAGKAAFSRSGILFLAPILNTDALRKGEALASKEISITIKGYQAGSDDELVLRLRVVDYTRAADATFFGDRPLHDPGYHEFKLADSLGPDQGSANRLLDVWRVEQRLKYLGYPAYDAKKPAEFKVDGTFADAERRALQLFEKVVRYGTGPKTGEGQAKGLSEKNPWLKAEVEVKITYNSADGSYGEPVPVGTPKLIWSPAGKSLPDAARQVTIDTSIASATKDAIAKAKVKARADYDRQVEETKRFEPRSFGADGVLTPGDQEGGKTLLWLNAYNAPHWVRFNDRLKSGWEDRTGGKQSDMSSWVYDLMLLSQNAARAQGRPELLWYKGSGELGSLLNLGINRKFVSEDYQKSIYGDEWLLGLASPNSVDLKDIQASKDAGATAEQKLKYLLQEKERLQQQPGNGVWDAEKARQLADLLQYVNRVKPAGQLSNNQADALKDFLAVYSATQNDVVQGNGSLDEQLSKISSKGRTAEQVRKVQKILFGDGLKVNGLINADNILIGSEAENGGIGARLDATSLAAVMGRKETEVADWVDTLNSVLATSDINTAKLLALYLGNAAQETDRLEMTLESYRQQGNYVTEPQSYSTYEQMYSTITHPGNTLGNMSVGDGSKFRGRGLLHITGKNNYGLLSFGAIYKADGSLLESVNIDFNDWMGTKIRSAATSAGIPNTNKVMVTGMTEPNWWVRVEFPKSGNLPVERKDVQADAAGNYTVTSDNQHPVGQVKIMAVKYNFVDNAQQISDSAVLSAQVGSWYWRFAKNRDLNQNPDYNSAVKKINGGEDPGSSQGKSRRANYDRAKKALSLGNTYGNMREILGDMGIKSANKADYNTQFGIPLNKRPAVVIDKAAAELLADGPALIEEDSGRRELIDAMHTDFGVQPGDANMLFLNFPDTVPLPVYQTVLMVASNSAANTVRTDGVCEFTSANTDSDYNPTSLYIDYSYHMRDFLPKDFVENRLGKGISAADLQWVLDWDKSMEIKIIRPPRHGQMLVDDSLSKHPSYRPDANFVGKDQVEVLVRSRDLQGHPISKKLVYFINVLPKAEMNNVVKHYQSMVKKYCGTNKPVWRIEESSKFVSASEATAGDVADLFAHAPTTFSDLPGTTVGETNGSGPNATITIDTDAAGHGWFVDSTPWSNEEFLPTSNPNEWIARPGSEAAGKMDLLTVLLHEYGHTLGLVHSVDAHDFMAATLQPGVRRTLSIDQQLVLTRLAGLFSTPASSSEPYGPTDPGIPLACTRVSGPAGNARLRHADDFAATDRNVPRYAIAANSTLTNPEFADGEGWTTTGDVSFASGAAILAESPTTQTRLNQVFVLGRNDRFLSFTIANTTLGDQADGPDDAFEVALLDANTGLSLLSGTGLTHSDAIINRQADGSEHTASGITVTTNLDGSRSYLVDLAGVHPLPATGTVVNLAFDLIGFGQGAAATNSRVTLRDLHLSGEAQDPHARDDVATTLEDHPVQIDALANDLNVDELVRQPGFTPIIVDRPAHGQVIVSSDPAYGHPTLTYTPEKDWHGEDRFSYKLTDGPVDSNVATVVLTVTPVNDTPVVTERRLDLDEDSHITVDLLAGASDVDGDALSVNITAMPQHGTLSKNADGTSTYAPTADWYGTDTVEYEVGDGTVTIPSRISFTVNAINDAPVLTGQSLAGREDEAVSGSLLATAADIDSGSLTARIVNGPAHGRLLLGADGSFRYTPATNWNGNDRFSYTVSDGTLESAIAEVVLDIAPVNDAPVATDRDASLPEDGQITLDLLASASDADGDRLSVTVVSLPQHGTLSPVDPAEGAFTYTPDANWSGEDRFSYVVGDGLADSAIATVQLSVAPVPDTPTLRVADGPAAIREVFRSSWETAPSGDGTSILLKQNALEGWRLVTQPDPTAGGVNGFEIWTSGQRMTHPGGATPVVFAAAGDGSKWLEINNAGGSMPQTLGIERSIATIAGASYTLSLDLAGRPGYSAEYTRIAISVDGVAIGSDASTSPGDALTWQSRSFGFVGTGSMQTVRIASAATRFDTNGRGMMLDNIALTETLPINTGLEGTAIRLSAISAVLNDTDGSETLAIALTGIPVGARVRDGSHGFTATDGQRTADVTGWDLAQLSITPPANAIGRFTLGVVATASEQATGNEARSTASTEVTVLARVVPPTTTTVGSAPSTAVKASVSTSVAPVTSTVAADSSTTVATSAAPAAIALPPTTEPLAVLTPVIDLTGRFSVPAAVDAAILSETRNKSWLKEQLSAFGQTTTASPNASLKVTLPVSPATLASRSASASPGNV